MNKIKEELDEIFSNNDELIQEIVGKYSDVLDKTSEDDIKYIAYIIDVAAKHVNEKHIELKKDWKSWSVFFIRNEYLIGKLNSIEDIPKLIDNFLVYYSFNFENFSQNIRNMNGYDKSRSFVEHYEKKIGSI